MDRGRIRSCRQRGQRLQAGEVGDQRTLSASVNQEDGSRLDPDDGLQLGHGTWALVGDVLTEPVELDLGILHGGCSHGPPETLGGVVDGLLHTSFAVPPSRRARIDADPVVLGHRQEAGLDPAGLRADHRGHPVDPPAFGRAAEPMQDAVDSLDQMGLVLGLAELTSELPRARKRADQQVPITSPGCFGELVPVPLDLMSGGMEDLDGGST